MAATAPEPGTTSPKFSSEVMKQFDCSIRLLGESGFSRLNQATVAVLGVSPLVFEVSKNLLLSGVPSLILSAVGQNETVKAGDLACNFCLRDSDVGQSCFNTDIIGRLSSVQSGAKIQVLQSKSTAEVIKSLTSAGIGAIVCCGLPKTEVIAINDECTPAGIPLIYCDSLGLSAMMMCDFGEDWAWKDDPNSPPKSAMISHICKSDTLTVISVSEDETHGLSDGDSVMVSGVTEGMTELNERVFEPVSVLTPHSISVPEDSTPYTDYKKGGIITHFRKDQHCHHSRLSRFLAKEFPSDLESSVHVSGDMIDKSAAQWCCSRLFPFIRSHPGESTDALSAEIAAFSGTVSQQLKSVLSMGSVSVAPMVSLIGGLASFEAVKAVSQCFKPLSQCLFTNALRYFGGGISDSAGLSPRNQCFAQCFGPSALQSVLQNRLLLVGDSMISSEVIKNLALIGVGSVTDSAGEFKTDSEGDSAIADLSAPLLTVVPVGQSSSQSNGLIYRSSDALCDLNSSIMAKNVKFEDKSLIEDESILNVDMFGDLACVLSATDNIESRLKLDSLCLRSKTGLIDSTMMNSIGKCQVFIPHITECLSSNRDHIRMQGGTIATEYKKGSFKICTIRNFPFRIEHCLKWATEMFVAVFKESTECVCEFISNGSGSSGRMIGKLERDWLEQRLMTFRPKCLKDCVWFARFWFQQLFADEIKQLIHSFPEDHTLPDGSSFWVGSKLFPCPMAFDIRNDLHRSMIRHCSLLYARVYGLSISESELDGSGLDAMLEDQPKMKEFVPDSKAKIATSDEEFERMASVESSERISMPELPSMDSLTDLTLTVMSEEEYKSDETAMALVHCLANLRAANYGISPASMFESQGWMKELSGLSPCLAASLAGCMTLECIAMCLTRAAGSDGLAKHMKDWTMTMDSSVDECVLNQSIPRRCRVHSVQYKDINTSESRSARFSLWDEIVVKGAHTLQDVLDYFTKDFGCEVGMVSYGSSILYAFFHSASKQTERASKDLVSLIEEMTKSKLDKPVKDLYMEVSLSDADDNDVEVPTVRVEYSA